MDDLVRQLIAQAAETRNLDYKGPMAWEGPKAVRAELIRDLMCFANTVDGGYILLGVAEGPIGWNPVGVSEAQAQTFDPTKIGDLAQGFCSVLPVFRVHRVTVDDKLYVLLVVDEFDAQPIVCIKDCHGPSKDLVLRGGAIYTRTVDARCSEIRSAEAMRALLDIAVRNQGDALLGQIIGLLGSRSAAELPPSDEEQFAQQRMSSEGFFSEHGLLGPHWQVEIRPEHFTERIVDTRQALSKARDDAKVGLRGWDFPHVDRTEAAAFIDGVQSVTRWGVHHEAHRLFLSGMFIWRELISEDFEDDRFKNTLIYESTIWLFAEFWLFANRFLTSSLERGNVVVDVSVHGLKGRKLAPSRRSVSLFPGHACNEEEYRRRHTLSVGELRASHLDKAASDAIDLFELFGTEVAPAVIRSWQEKLLKREF